MKAAILSTFDTRGGAAIATYRLHMALRKSGADSRMFVASKDSRDPSVEGRDTWLGDGVTKLRTTLDNLPLRRYPHRRGIFSAAWVPDRLRTSLRSFQPDVVHLFWVTGGMVRIESLEDMDRPIVWTLHDMWPFTGGCHYDDECGKYAEDCGRCPVLQSDKEDDLSRSVLRRKRAAWAGKSITVVATSKWLRDCAASSSLFKECRIELLPNCVDTQKYQPLEKAPVRRLFGLDVNAKTILFSGANAHKDPRKGLKHLFDALQILEQRGFAQNEVQVVLLGIPQEAALPPARFGSCGSPTSTTRSARSRSTTPPTSWPLPRCRRTSPMWWWKRCAAARPSSPSTSAACPTSSRRGRPATSRSRSPRKAWRRECARC